MSVPDFQSLMLPLLQFAADGKEHALTEARPFLARQFGLSKAEREERLPSGRQSRFDNRVSWAKAYLQLAGIVLSPRKGWFQISARGREILANPPGRIDIKFLERFPEFLASRRTGKNKNRSPDSGAEPGNDVAETPEEALETAHLQMRTSLAAEVLERAKAVSAPFFEQLVVDLLLKMGYGGPREEAGEVVGRPGDEGIDGIISEDRLGLDLVYLQAKKWMGTIGRPEIQKFVGALHGKRARKGVFITTGTFTTEAKAYVEHIDPKVVLIDGPRLADLMIDFEVGVAIARTFQVKRVDSDYFEEN